MMVPRIEKDEKASCENFSSITKDKSFLKGKAML